ncbi:hypothetical protein BpJC7_00300 [Weizmannia acidilactici]|uniref:Uncharacterized protein n=1 Tax=Weizmannia acidilactici TaxID=2607726 RepID=A0A5J4JDX2_9BACI|nr:hypothetical protein [Weizmannia acidilactici]GER67472.1 hypothetical protein BpJC4_19430 [Weizmannia acidilactici]GER68727.1 hypothetical protein BpJC7_00300 [Weizmannia acidilactici]GER74227.1 hypothetical protein BpPP18_22940 [Weizmannia acidilactici]
MAKTTKAHFFVSLITSILLFLQAGLGLYTYFTSPKQNGQAAAMHGGMGQATFGGSSSSSSSSSSGSSYSSSTNSMPSGMPSGMKQTSNSSFSLMRMETGTAGLVINLVFLLVSLFGFLLAWKVRSGNKVEIE